jgi:hypothetical protein
MGGAMAILRAMEHGRIIVGIGAAAGQVPARRLLLLRRP